jgi:hypothetical protein
MTFFQGILKTLASTHKCGDTLPNKKHFSIPFKPKKKKKRKKEKGI